MKFSHSHSTVSVLLPALFWLTFLCHGISLLAQTSSGFLGEKTAYVITKIDAAAIRAFQEAWHVSRNGSDGFEGLVLVYPTPDGKILARSQGKSAEQKHFSFGWTSNIIAVVHTHPNDVDPKPGGDDIRLADRFGVPVFTITRRGMYVYDPCTKKIRMVQEGLDWLESAKWSHDGQSVSAKR